MTDGADPDTEAHEWTADVVDPDDVGVPRGEGRAPEDVADAIAPDTIDLAGERVDVAAVEAVLEALVVASGDGVEVMLPSHGQLQRVAREAGVPEWLIERALEVCD
jgi:hypothetical protein